jgi:hypothetical protein
MLNSKGEVVYLELEGDQFGNLLLKLDQYDIVFNLETLIINNNKKTHYKQNDLKAFFSKTAKNLKTLKIRNNPSYRSELSQLKKMISVLKDYPIEIFAWEYQGDISRENLIDKIALEASYWENLKELSFEGTELDEDDFIIPRLNLKNLKVLNLTNTDLENDMLYELVANKHMYPQLYELNLNDNDFDNLEINDSIPSLKILSLYEKDKTEIRFTLQNFLAATHPFLRNLDRLYLDSQSTSYVKGATFIYKANGHMINMSSRYLPYLTKYFPNIKHYGLFIHDPSNFTETIRSNIQAEQYFIAQRSDIIAFKLLFKEKPISHISFVGEFVSNDMIRSILDEFKVERVSLVDIPFNSEFELKQLVADYKTIQFNQLSFLQPTRSGYRHFNSFNHFDQLNQMMHRQMQMQIQQNIQNIQQNIPKFR